MIFVKSFEGKYNQGYKEVIAGLNDQDGSIILQVNGGSQVSVSICLGSDEAREMVDHIVNLLDVSSKASALGLTSGGAA